MTETEDLQEKINKWWAGLTPEEREEWPSKHDLYTRPIADPLVDFGKQATFIIMELPSNEIPCYIVASTSVSRGRICDVYRISAETFLSRWYPIACPQLWWKLAWQYLGVKRFLSALYDAGLIKTRSHEYDRGWGSITSFKDDDEERIKGITIDAALAVQRGEG